MKKEGQSRGKPVLKKDIYIIRNDENTKCYIGQSVDYLYRFRKHKEEARRKSYKYKSFLYDDMNRIGFNHFYVEVLEEQVDNPDEREMFWINELNTLHPNGYNLSTGGIRYPNLSGTLSHRAKITSEETLDNIYDKLINTDLSIADIAKYAGVTYDIILSINEGNTYIREGYTYPLRKISMTKYEVDRLTFDLKYSNKSYSELAKIYNISLNHVKAINYGISWNRDYIKYPIRKILFGSKSEATKIPMIQNALISTDKTFSQIGEEYGCSENTVRRINSGETHKNDELTYPLRRIKERLSQEKILNVCKLLSATNKSIREISEITGIPASTIRYINSGKATRYIISKYNYPIRRVPVSTIHA